MSKYKPQHAMTRAQARRARGRRRTILWVALSIAGVILVVGGIGFFLVVKAFAARDALTAAIPLASQLPQKMIAGDSDGAAQDAKELKDLAAQARSETDNLLWRGAELVPFVGQNLAAVRVASASVDDIARLAVDAVPNISIDALKPVDGAIDLEAIHGILDTVEDADRVFGDVQSDLDELDRWGLVPQVSSALTTLDSAVDRVTGALDAAAPLVPLLPAMLGEGTPRNYLLMFQGNSEARASGGNPAALALVNVTDGRIEMTTQATSVQFANARPESVVPLDAETEHIYSDIIGRWIPNMTATPHFPTTVDIMRGWWTEEGLPPFDAVISVDPVALSYVLAATGPIQLDTGETLTSENAVSLLLNEVYFKYGEGHDATEQDVFFALAAAKIFQTVLSGIDNPVGFVNALVRSTDEGRLKLWSSNEDETALLAGTKLAGILPESNDDETVAGVYFNDTTGSKMDYYVTAAVTASTDQCTTTGQPRFSQTVTLNNTITPEAAAALPWFITGPHFAPGVIATDVVIYSPVGATIDSWSVEGAQKQYFLRQATHLGRDVVRLNVITTPQTTAKINVVMTGAADAPASSYGTFDVRTTPMVWPTPVTIDAPGCAAPE